MTRPLTSVPTIQRRRLAGVLGLLATLLVAVGAVALTGTGAALTAFAVIAIAGALVVALVAWGLAWSVHVERVDIRTEAAVDAAIEAVVAASPHASTGCGCGHVHDPDELNVHDDPCAHDGAGSECSRSCDTCVLSRLSRTAVNETVPAGGLPRTRRRPSPTPR